MKTGKIRIKSGGANYSLSTRFIAVAVAVAFSSLTMEKATAVSFENVVDGMSEVQLKGFLGERLDAMIEHHVAACDVDYITSVFSGSAERGNRWQAEFWGKWMHSAVPYLRYTGNGEWGTGNGALRNKIERGIERILASQDPSGYIGNYPDELRCGDGWDVWGMKYTMMGLLHYYDWECKVESGKRKVDESDESSRLSSNVSRPKSALALDACRRLCDYLIAEIGPDGKRGRELWQTGNWSGYASSSILEPVVWLYRRTGEDKYFDFATYIVKGMAEPESGPRLVDLALKGVSVADRNGYGNVAETHGGYVMKRNRWKAYEMMSCYQGLLEYVEVITKVGVQSSSSRAEQFHSPAFAKAMAGKPTPIQNSNSSLQLQLETPTKLLQAVLMTAEDIAANEVNLAGGCSSCEAWFHGAKKQHLAYAKMQETCVTTTWMRLCEKLLRITDDPKWADRIEQSFYNAYLGSLRSDGREFAAYTPLSGYRWHGMHHCFMHTDCCTSNGPRGFLCFLKELCRRDGDVVTFNFYASVNVPGFEMYSLYPRTGSVRILSHTSGRMTVRFRMPGWCLKPTVSVNGVAYENVKPGCYAVVDREWNVGDVVELEFDMEAIVHVNNGHLAITRGPILLARDNRLERTDIGEPFRRGFSDGERISCMSPVRTPSDKIWMAFSAVVPVGSHYENPEGRNLAAVMFCDYASAGNDWSPENFYRTWFPIERVPGED